MNFFEQQDQAHRQSKKLLFLFFLAVVAIVVTVDFSIAFVWHWSQGSRTDLAQGYPPGFFLLSSLLTLAVIAGGTLFEIYQLRDGGDAVAQMAGGRLVLPASEDIHERRLLNIVEEMALASGIACPRVYVLDNEDAINAFAAGYHQNEAVVAVTRGTLMRLNRDELQGVVGHEFSHILNGDMRMNIRLIGVLFGIQMIAGLGQELMYWGSRLGSSRSRDEKGPPIQLVLLALGVILFVVGYVGIFFGRLIKSAVSRQREFLADASSVQFTRNPDGIGGALRKIGGLTRTNECGSRIDNPRAEQLSHLFLGAARPNLLSGLFATHPPLEERLQRVYGKNVAFLEPVDEQEGMEAESAAISAVASAPFNAAGTARDIAGFGAHSAALPEMAMAGLALATAVPAKAAASSRPNPYNSTLLEAARAPQSAFALVLAMLMDRRNPDAYRVQQQLLAQSAAGSVTQAEQLLLQLEALQNNARLPLLDLAMPALKLLSPAQRGELLALSARLITADQQMTQAEFVIQSVLERRLGPDAGRAIPVRYGQIGQLRSEVCLLGSLVARSFARQDEVGAAWLRLAGVLPELQLQPSDLQNTAEMDFFDVRIALQKCNQLAPLAKPFLIKALFAAATPGTGSAEHETIDLLRAVCAAIDAPVPELASLR
ncbi:M48 family metallopeptidase [Undibacterium oligocarboniphilum]|uniref:M48 family metallopeptidase n=1 Tax=Undibacterium oligocarboniphilum TaxID=666702 RepID=A0A850QGG7_9BURK|nr:M48 family metallopeptidase [Undibacterium oligocarboniphilum]MBC3870924.1 M48 family metallopeptidase [Undibacterium oligocarboniphilum]NVO76453.1 M48 family metallopeptidase [Undibacterium oligocarboniphilum]